MEKNSLYSKEVMNHFLKPKNRGEIKNADAIGEKGNPSCGDVMKVYLKVNNKTNKIKDIKFQTMGCAAAIATSSMITELAKGKTIEQAKKISNKDIADKLGGLPKLKMHCSNLAVDTLRRAIENFEKN